MDARAVARRIVDEVLADFTYAGNGQWYPLAHKRFGPYIFVEMLRAESRQQRRAMRARALYGWGRCPQPGNLLRAFIDTAT